MKLLTIGIIGVGWIGKLHAANLMTRVKETKLKTVTDPFIDEKWAFSKGIPVTGKDHRIILEDSEIDAVLVCSPSSQHKERQERLHISLNKWVLLELIKIKFQMTKY